MRPSLLPMLTSIVIVLLLAAMTGCGGSGGTAAGTGSVAATLQWNGAGKPAKTAALAPAGVTTIRAIVSAPDMQTIQRDFPAPAATGTIGGVPAGSGRTVTFQGLDGNEALLYEGTARNVTIRAGEATYLTVDMVAVAFTVAGTIFDGATPVPGVVVSLLDALDSTRTAVTDAQGFYSFTAVHNGSYTLKVLMTGYLVTPDTVPITVNGADVTGQNLTAIGSTRFVSILAGSPGIIGAQDGTGSEAFFNRPTGITIVADNLYVADSQNHCIRKIFIPTMQVNTIAGSLGVSGSVDGTGPAARFKTPTALTNDGTNLYVADSGNNLIRKVVIASGQVTTIAGSGTSGSEDGIGAAARFNNSWGIATDGTNLYVADTFNFTIRKVVITTGQVTTLAGTAGVSGSSDGTGAAATFAGPAGITTDGYTLYVTDWMNHTVRKIAIATRTVTTIAGWPGATGKADGIGTAARFNGPSGAVVDGDNLYVTDNMNFTIRKIAISSRAVTTIAGTPQIADYADSLGSWAKFKNIQGITGTGKALYIAEYGNQIIRVLK